MKKLLMWHKASNYAPDHRIYCGGARLEDQLLMEYTIYFEERKYPNGTICNYNWRAAYRSNHTPGYMWQTLRYFKHKKEAQLFCDNDAMEAIKKMYKLITKME